MVLVVAKTSRGDFYVVAEDESEARSQVLKQLRSQFFSETIQIDHTQVIACSKRRYSNNILIL